MEKHICNDREVCPLCTGKIKKLTTNEKTQSQGNSRVVFRVGDYVLKVQKTGWPTHSDMEAWLHIQNVYPEFTQYFVPTLAQGDGWSIQPFVDLYESKDYIIDDDDDDEYAWANDENDEDEWAEDSFGFAWEEVEEIVNELQLSDISPGWNWGIRKDTGRPVIYDYRLE